MDRTDHRWDELAVAGMVAAALVLAIDIALLALGIARFRRTRLILE
jgi:hypothetical protein